MNRPTLALAAVLAVATAAWADPPQGSPYRGDRPPGQLRAQIGMPNALVPVRIEQRNDTQLPLHLAFKDEAGADVTLGTYFNKRRPVVLVLAYFRCPQLCTKVLNGLVEALKRTKLEPGKDFDLVTVSFDPRDTPEMAADKKKAYVEDYGRKGAAEGWHFLTGEPDAIKTLTEAVGFYYYFDEKQQEFAHASGLIVLTPEGRTASYVSGVDYVVQPDPAKPPVNEVEAALTKAGAGTVSPPRKDWMTLVCYQYDADKQAYTLSVFKIVRAAGVVTVLGLAGMVVYLRLRERKRPAPPPAPEG